MSTLRVPRTLVDTVRCTSTSASPGSRWAATWKIKSGLTSPMSWSRAARSLTSAQRYSTMACLGRLSDTPRLTLIRRPGRRISSCDMRLSQVAYYADGLVVQNLLPGRRDLAHFRDDLRNQFHPMPPALNVPTRVTRRRASLEMPVRVQARHPTSPGTQWIQNLSSVSLGYSHQGQEFL